MKQRPTLHTERLVLRPFALADAKYVQRLELGYWIGYPYWNQGYCTEAAQVVLVYGFSILGLNRIHGRCLKRNPASGRVMEKIGMVQEGCLRAHDKKWEQFEDLVLYGILKSEWHNRTEHIDALDSYSASAS